MSLRRGMVMLEMIAVVSIMAVGSALMTVGIGALLDANRRLSETTNRQAVLVDFLSTLRRDVRRTERLRTADELHVDLDFDSVAVSYTVHPDRVERSGGAVGGARAAWPTEWLGQVAFRSEDARLLTVEIVWKRREKDDPRPTRRFEVTMRCAGESEEASP